MVQRRRTYVDFGTCPRCKSNRTYMRVSSNTFRCGKCGHIWPTGEEVHTAGGDFFDDRPLTLAEQSKPMSSEEFMEELAKREGTSEDEEPKKKKPKPKRKMGFQPPPKKLP